MPKTKRKRHEHTVTETIFITGTLVMFWRGVWGLMDIYLLPVHPQISYAISLALSVLLFVFAMRKHTKHLL